MSNELPPGVSPQELVGLHDRAADWFVRRQQPDWTGADERALDAWLGAHPLHRSIFEGMSRHWHGAPQLRELFPDEFGAAVPPAAPAVCAAPAAAPPRQRVLARWPGRPAAALSVLAVVSLLAWGGWYRWDHTPGYTLQARTAPGQTQSIELPDGSRVALNVDSELQVRYYPRRREVVLDRGEAFFEVTPGPDRPFTVDSGASRVRVVGTAFNVRAGPPRLVVKVLVAAVGAIWGAGWSAGVLPGSVRYYMAQEVRRSVQLPDHSQVQLNQRTGLVYLGFRDERQVLLRNGEAYFDVHHDPEKPFVIGADNASIRVTGTHFNVWTAPELTTVTVTQGSVLASRNDASHDNHQGAVLTAGMQAAFGPDQMVQLARIDPSRAAAWRNGKLMLDDVSLREALPLINRYLDVPLKLASSDVGDLRFGGTYDTAELAQLVSALPKILPVKVRHTDQATLLLRR